MYEVGEMGQTGCSSGSGRSRVVKVRAKRRGDVTRAVIIVALHVNIAIVA
jgi:hypothetical protein